MEKIGVFICNYNGKEYVLNCLKSLFQQTMQEFDVYVVDNASTDGSEEAILDQYGEKVTILKNNENLGGAGGFDRGLKVGLDKNYEYLVLLDNDILLEKSLLENMKNYLDEHGDVGITGSKVMIMDMPELIQDFGDYLDFEKFREKNGYCMQNDSADLPLVNECDYVPTCAVMIRSEVLKHSGTMPADNFIYYDDIELSHKIACCGYKVVALGNAKVWHKGGFRKASVNTFSEYYFLRNRLHFFAKYIMEEDIEKFANTAMSEVFSRLVGFKNKGMDENIKTLFYAFDDFLHHVRGKAMEHKILQIQKRESPFVRAVRNKKKIEVIFMDNFNKIDPLDIFHIFLYLVTMIQKNQSQKEIYVSLKECSYTSQEFQANLEKVIQMDRPDFPMPSIIVSESDQQDYDISLKICEHVRLVQESVLPCIYVDRYCNCITNEEEYKYFTGLSASERLFLDMYRPIMLQTIKEIRKGDRS